MKYFLPVRAKLFIITYICEDVGDYTLSHIFVVRMKWYNDLAILFIYALDISERLYKKIVEL